MKVRSVNVGRSQLLNLDGRSVASGMHKAPVEGAALKGLGLEGDEQADLSVHGGLCKAIYAYGMQHYPFWQTVRAQAGAAQWSAGLACGALGENLSIDALVEDQLWIGDRWVLPNAVLVVSEPRFPCFKFNTLMGFAHASSLMQQSGYCGTYLAVEQGGYIRAGDTIEIDPGPREVGIAELFRARYTRHINGRTWV